MNKIQIQKEVWFQATKSSGPGGQNVNKVSSAAILFWPYLWSSGISESEKNRIKFKMAHHINKNQEIYIKSDESRHLERNKMNCIEKLFSFLKDALYVPKPRKKTKPTKSSKLKRIQSKRIRGETKNLRKKVNSSES